jgi:hypothetical protein
LFASPGSLQQVFWRYCFFTKIARNAFVPNLILSPTKKYFGFGENDFVVDGGRVIGRIFLQPQAPEGRPWFWTIAAPDIPPLLDKRGYAATREEAMADFKARCSGQTIAQVKIPQ